MKQRPDDLEKQLRELGNIPVPGSLLKNIQTRIGQLTPEWAGRQYQLGCESHNLSEGDHGKNLAMAIGHFQNALHVYTSEAFPLQRVEVLYDAGCTYRELSDLPEKDRLTNLEKAVTRYKEAQTIVNEHHLADEWLAKLDQAISECYQQRIQELKHCADVEKAIADVLRLNDQRVSALANYNQALRLYRLVESRLDEAIVLKDLGDVHCSLQDMDAAMPYYRQALACFEQMDHRHDVATVLQAMGDVAQSRGEDEAARQYHHQALDLFRLVGDRFSEASVLASMGKQADLYRKVGETNISHMEFRSFDENVAVLDHPAYHEPIGGIPPDGAMPMRDTSPPPENPERQSLISHTEPIVTKRQKQRRQTKQRLSILLILIILIGGTGAVATLLRVGPFHNRGAVANPLRVRPSHSSCATAPNQLRTSAHGIGVVKTGAGECIGLSDGSVAFDINQPGRSDSALKQQAAGKLAMGDRKSAITLLQQAVKQDGSDAEARIYLEDLQVLQSGQPYLTLIVGTKITGEQIDLTGERRLLQGAYVAQQEYNQKCTGKCPRLRLLIANTGNDANNAEEVVNQIVQAAKSDSTIIGVEGWSVSQDTFEVVSALQAAGIPMVASSASSDWLTGISPYFFRVAPPDSSQGALGANYAMNTLHAQRIALFVDPSNAYSESLAGAFKYNVSSGSVARVQTYTYTVGTYAENKQLVDANLKEVANYHPDLIYFAGYSADAGTLLEELSTSKLAQVPVMGGDDLYNLIGTSDGNIPGLDHLIFTAFASPNEWRYVGVQEPPFFSEYAKIFAAGGVQSNKDTPTGEVILAYDAMRVLLQASQTAFADKQATLTGQDLQQALKNMTGTHAFQGVSGQIAFGQDGNPHDKTVVLLKVDKQGQAYISGTSGTFLIR
jgi:ABC-type branched-subunit amino acid transport system substrate-binding protein